MLPSKKPLLQMQFRSIKQTVAQKSDIVVKEITAYCNENEYQEV
jgi:hypothetical protein